MYAHLRIYTVNKGMMDEWVKLFNEKLIPLLIEADIKVESSWVNEEKSQFIWIRSYGNSLDDIEKKEEKFYIKEKYYFLVQVTILFSSSSLISLNI